MPEHTTRFTDAIYQRKKRYDFEATTFNRRMLKILMLIDGKRSVAEIATLLSTEIRVLMPDFINLVKLGLIQTEGSIISSDESAPVFSDHQKSEFEEVLTVTM